jgi:drug/metabolite transporter (DMT)-like permease
MGGAAALFSLLNVSAKYLSEDFPLAQLLWVRSAGHLLFVLALFGPRFGRRLFATWHPGVQLLRSTLLLGSTACNFVALRFVGLATAATINFTSPAIVALLAAPLLGERVGRARWTAIGIGFLGVLIVVRPGAEAAQVASLLSLGTAVCYALYQLLTRRVAADDPPETTVGYSALVGTLALTAVVPFAWAAPPSAWKLALLLSMGLTGGLGHYFVARAYYSAPASAVSPFNYVQLLGAALMDYVVFQDPPGLAVWLGATLIIGSGLFIAYAERRV